MSSDSSPIRVLVVDDHQLIRVGIATLLLPELDMKLVGEASNDIGLPLASSQRSFNVRKGGGKHGVKLHRRRGCGSGTMHSRLGCRRR